MDRNTLETAAATFPYLQGLWSIPMGFMLMVAGASNLEHGPQGAGLLVSVGVGLALAAGSAGLIGRFYRDHYGTVTPTRERRIRSGVAVAAWAAVLFVGANRYLLWSAKSAVCVFAVAFAAATLVYYAILVGVRAHHLVIWGLVATCALVPIWGGLGADRDALAMFPLGAALIVSGLFDQRILARSMPSAGSGHIEGSHA
jgi:hypothetical protein